MKSVNMLSFVYICIQNNINDKPYGDSLSFMTDTVFPGAIKITINTLFFLQKNVNVNYIV